MENESTTREHPVFGTFTVKRHETMDKVICIEADGRYYQYDEDNNWLKLPSINGPYFFYEIHSMWEALKAIRAITQHARFEAGGVE
jgi:hypothetical protein